MTPVLANGLLLELEWQQDHSQHSDWSQQCCSLDCLHPSRCFLVLQSLNQSFHDCTKSTNYNWYNRHFHVPQCFQFPSKVMVYISRRLSVLLSVSQGKQCPQLCKFSLSCSLLYCLVVWPRLGDGYVCRNPREVIGSNSPGQILVCAYTICSYYYYYYGLRIWFLIILRRLFTRDIGGRNLVIICILFYCLFCVVYFYLFW